NEPLRAAYISARIDRLPAVATIWRLVALLSIAGFFELYDLFQTAYISPGLIREGIFATGSQGLFGFSDQAAFASATFLGLFFGASLVSPIADRYGRRAIFTFALIWYTVATVIMGLQTSALGVIGMRFVVGIGLGVELVTIDTYLSELVPKRIRSSAFAFAFFIQFLSVPSVALMSWWLVPQDPFGFSGWRWVVISSAVFALFVWWLRSALPESPRWLASKGRFDEAQDVLEQLRPSTQDAQREIDEMKAQDEEARHRPKARELLRQRWVIKLLLIGVGLGFTAQFTGVNAFMYYTPIILKNTGMGTNAALTATIGNGVVSVIATLLGIWAIGRYGRRHLLMTGLVIVILMQAALGCVLQFMPQNMTQSYTALACILVFLLF
ncbi:major facilitator transporter, partial [Pseudomonas syringae pv. pisi str. 1704B]